MSKYNDMISIPIDDIPEDEKYIAIEEWAEGDMALKRLLTECYEKGIKTCGCHAGSHPYIDFIYQDNIERISSLFNVVESTPNSSVQILVDGENPFSGTEWYKSVIHFTMNTNYQDEADEFFDSLTESIKKEEQNIHNPFLDLLNFFQNKESELCFRFMNIDNNKYDFVIESLKLEDRYSYFDKLFTNSGLEEIKTDHPRYYWGITSNDLTSIKEKIEDISKFIIKNYNFESPDKEENITNFHLLARYKMKHLSEDDFNEWLHEQKKRMNIGKL